MDIFAFHQYLSIKRSYDSATPTSPLWLTILFSEWMIVLTELTLDAVDLAAKIIYSSMRTLDEGQVNVDCDDWSMP